jgi:hypothetical protein
MRLKKLSARDKTETHLSFLQPWCRLVCAVGVDDYTLVIVYESGNCVKSERIMSEKSVSADTSVLNQPVNAFFVMS